MEFSRYKSYTVLNRLLLNYTPVRELCNFWPISRLSVFVSVVHFPRALRSGISLLRASRNISVISSRAVGQADNPSND